MTFFRSSGPRSALAGLAAVIFMTGAAAADTKTFDFAGFDGVAVSEGIHMRVVTGDAFSVIAESDEPKQLERLEVDMRRGILRAEMDNKWYTSFRRIRGWKITVTVTMPEINEAVSSSGADLKIDRMSGDVVEVTASSGSSLEIGEIEAGQLSANASSGSRIKADTGSCDSFKVIGSSGSFLTFPAVECGSVKAIVSSGSQVKAFARDMIDANASSGSLVEVHGPHEKIELNTSSGGRIEFP